ANAPFKTLSPPELGQWLEQWPQTVMIDLRDSLSFHNQHPEAARNQGHIANALNIPYDSLEAELPALLPFKNEPVVLYSSTDSPEVYTAAQMLAAKGFTQVRLLAGGFKQLRWYPANKEGFSWLEDLVVNVPEANK
ncbi:MAG TPA: rhodanese-like domain-containing protein, partial [Phnomibacter sp.]|nr:rhodanese-like domain-containing protein [Phnomibacter sp.]